MFARLLSGARSIFRRSISAPDIPTVRSPSTTIEPQDETAIAVDDDSEQVMVTTRRGYDTNSPAVHDAATKTGVKRRSENADTPTATNKRRRASAENLPRSQHSESPVNKRGINGRIDNMMGLSAAAGNDATGEEKPKRPVGKPTLNSAGSKDGAKTTPVKKRTRRSQGDRQSPEVVIDAAAEHTDTTAEQVQQQFENEMHRSLPASSAQLDSDSVYATPATQGTASVYATPATHLKPKDGRSAVPASTSKAARARLATLGEEQVESSETEGSEIVLGTPQVHTDITSPGSKGKTPNPNKKGKTPSAQKNDIPTNSNAAPASTSTSTTTNPDAPAPKAAHPTTTLPKPKHIRFPSEEPPSVMDSLLTALQKSPEIPSSTAASEPAVASQNPSSPSSSEDEDEDDEAPETITLATAVAAARTADAEAAKAIEGQEAAAKRKRQERSRRLEEQARGSKKSRRRERDAGAGAVDDEEGGASVPLPLPAPEEQDGEIDLTNLTNLPALLPASILAAAPAVRPPTPPPSQAQQQRKQNKHLKFLDAATKPVKDVQRGPVRVRVLEETNPLLAPKMGRGSMGVREKWLMGRQYQQGGKGKGMGTGRLERREKVGGFLRK